MSTFKYRHIVPEIIDDFNMQGNEMEQNLEEIEWINKNLGGTKTSAMPILSYIQKNLGKKINVVDVGCGSGDTLKYIHSSVNNRGNVELTGIDANENIIQFAHTKHFLHSNVKFIHADVIHDAAKIPKADVYMLNLFLHHFEMPDINKILSNITQHQPELIVINDLERSRLSYLLFTLLCYFKNASFVTFNDGRLSIKKGFSRNEMKDMGKTTEGYHYRIKWQWAFRWQLLIFPINANKY